MMFDDLDYDYNEAIEGCYADLDYNGGGDLELATEAKQGIRKMASLLEEMNKKLARIARKVKKENDPEKIINYWKESLNIAEKCRNEIEATPLSKFDNLDDKMKKVISGILIGLGFVDACCGNIGSLIGLRIWGRPALQNYIIEDYSKEGILSIIDQKIEEIESHITDVEEKIKNV